MRKFLVYMLILGILTAIFFAIRYLVMMSKNTNNGENTQTTKPILQTGDVVGNIDETSPAIETEISNIEKSMTAEMMNEQAQQMMTDELGFQNDEIDVSDIAYYQLK